MLNRCKSAPVIKQWKPQKPPLDIPKPQLYNLFNGEAKNIYFPSESNEAQNSSKPELTSLQHQILELTQNMGLEKIESIAGDLEPVAPSLIEAQNIGKKPIVKISDYETEKELYLNRRVKSCKVSNRPKTVVANYVNQEKFNSLKKRSQSSCSIKARPMTGSSKTPQNLSIRPGSNYKDLVTENEKFTIENYGKMIRKSTTSANFRNTSSPSQNTIHLVDNWKCNLLERE